jgi:GT2 family glycosyltransferase
MELSVIIVNYKGWSILRECLDALSISISKEYASEIIVVDNNSDDGIIDPFSEEYKAFRFIRNERNGGFAYGCNRGARESTGKYLLFLNPDTVAGENTVDLLLEKAKMNPDDYIISCKQKDETGGESIAYGRFLAPGKLTGPGRALNRLVRETPLPIKGSDMENPLHPDWVSGSVLMISRGFFNRLGGFDEAFWMYYEDMDLCKRARGLGGEVLYFTDFSIMHKHGGSSRINVHTTALTKSEVLISKHLYVDKHFSPLSRICSQVFLVLNNLVAGMTGAAAGLILFFIPKIFVRTHIFIRLIKYYAGAITSRSWVSSRSVQRIR